VALYLVVTILTGMSGCMIKNNNSKGLNELAVEYMEQKYGEKFESFARPGGSLNNNHDLYVRCESLPNQNISVQVENYRYEDKVFRDNYLAVKYYDDTLGFLNGCAKQVFGEAIVFYDIDPQTLSPELSADATFEEYLADTRVPLNILLEVKMSSFVSEDQVVQLANLVSVNGTEYSLSVVFVDDDKYGIYDEGTLGKQMVLGDYTCLQISRFNNEIKIRWDEKE
jgi:hypothetical protein